jgi:asparagine synthase (glutamine-hydrolysing)
MTEEWVEANSVKLRELLDISVKKNLSDCILFSGGLDTSVVAAIASSYTQLTGVTVSFHDAPDVPYAKLIAQEFGMNHIIVKVGEEDVKEAAVDVVRIMKSFDPMEVRNDASIIIGLRAANRLGFRDVMTGDAGDELFAGYSFFFNLTRHVLERNLQNMWRIMRFASKPLAESLGMEAKLPFLDDADFKEFAMKIPIQWKVREERNKIYGKWILRKAFEGILPEEITWRMKVPIEQGSGTSTFSQCLEKKITDIDFDTDRNAILEGDGVRIRDKEQLFYFRIYKKEFGSPRDYGDGPKPCPGCGAHVASEINFCRTCGAYPI